MRSTVVDRGYKFNSLENKSKSLKREKKKRFWSRFYRQGIEIYNNTNRQEEDWKLSGNESYVKIKGQELVYSLYRGSLPWLNQFSNWTTEVTQRNKDFNSVKQIYRHNFCYNTKGLAWTVDTTWLLRNSV